MKHNTGFTLVELLAVVIILSVLTSIAVPQYTKSIKRSEAANALTMLKSVFDAAKRYKAERGNWPNSFQGLDTKLVFNSGSTDNTSNVFQFTFDDTNNAITLSRVPADNPPYQLKAYYSLPGHGRDTFTCKYNTSVSGAGKFKDLCDSMCISSFSGTECSINKSTFTAPSAE